MLTFAFSATFSSHNSSAYGAGCDDGFLVSRGRANSSALNNDVPVFDPQAIEDDDLIEDANDDVEEMTTEEAVHGSVALRDFAH